MAENMPPSVDSLSAAAEPKRAPASAPKTAPAAKPAASASEVSRAKRLLLYGGGTVYVLYVLWSLTLMAILPSASGGLKSFVLLGVFGALAGGIAFAGFFALAFMRVMQAKTVDSRGRLRSLIRAGGVAVPGILLSIIVPFMIMREPPLAIAIMSPTSQEDFVAPLAVTYSVEHAVELLKQRGERAVQFSWDFDGDGKSNEETVLPVATALYDRQGTYRVVVKITLDSGQSRSLTRRITIPQAVFSIAPLPPLVEQPLRFSILHLVKDPKDIKSVQWDFDGDGKTDVETTSTDVTHTFYSVGRVVVSATMRLSNQTQVVYKRALLIEKPAPLPFPVTLITEPKHLLGPAPFGAIFRIETQEPLREVSWTFGDGKEERGADLRRIAHVFETPGVYTVSVKIRSASGTLAELPVPVRVTETLSLPDLQFDGEPQVKGNAVSGEVPLTVTLTPHTSAPLIDFLWEAPDASSVNTSGSTLQAIYRREGSFTVTIVAQNPEGSVLRQAIKVEVKPPSTEAIFSMKPEGGAAPLRVIFDASETFVLPGEEIAGFKWKFGDEAGNVQPEVGAARVEHTYKNPGEYKAALSVILASGKEVSTERTIIVRKPSLDSCFTASRLQIHVGKGVEFDSSCSTGSPVSYLWDIRYDAEPSVIQAQSPEARYVYVFEKPGDYTVSLTLKDQFGNQDKQTMSLTVQP
jgi:PKD repeat protein